MHLARTLAGPASASLLTSSTWGTLSGGLHRKKFHALFFFLPNFFSHSNFSISLLLSPELEPRLPSGWPNLAKEGGVMDEPQCLQIFLPIKLGTGMRVSCSFMHDGVVAVQPDHTEQDELPILIELLKVTTKKARKKENIELIGEKSVGSPVAGPGCDGGGWSMLFPGNGSLLVP
ncbi:hypothetical protein EDC01DRAFT_726372 [Geopyxis carbonaria]|nr:hypothetical protein EDC01DRAFT_726372 [Geopyxis carbonaria]